MADPTDDAVAGVGPAALAEVVRRASDQDHRDPALTLEPSTVDAILAVMRAEPRPSITIPLLSPGEEPAGRELTVAGQSVAAVIRATADRMAGLEARRCRVSLVEPAVGAPTRPERFGEPTEPRPSEIAVTLGVAVHRGESIPGLAADLRDRVRAAVTAQVGLITTDVRIDAEDLLGA